MLWSVEPNKIKIMPFTSAVSNDYYKGIKQAEANSCNTVTMASQVAAEKAFFFGERFHGRI
jgi:type III secretory pathway lipoprotein EscJ